MKFYQPSVSFASGELAPVLAARVDLAAYNIGAKEITNFIVLPQGGLINRPGTRLLAQGSGLFGARLIPFIFNAATAYCIAYKTGGSIDVYDSGGVLIHSFRGRVYSQVELREIRWLQSADIMYVFHNNHPVQKISRLGATNWTMGTVDLKSGPYLDMNTDYTSNGIDLSQIEMSIRGGYLYSGVPYFTANHAGLLFKLEFKVPADGDSFTLQYAHNETNPPAASESGEFMLFGASTIKSSGTWAGRVEILRKLPEESAFTSVKVYRSDNDFNFGYQEDVELYGADYKVVYSRESGSGGVNIEWSSGGGLVARQVRTTERISSTTMRVTPLDDVQSNAGPSKDWSWGAFGAAFGYPALGIFHQERLVLANSPSQKQTLWMSKSASWEDFGTSIPTGDTDAITMTLAAKRVDEIVGLASRSDLLIFTVGGEWVAKAGSKSDVFTPSSIVVTPSGYHGSADIEPLEVGTSTLFVQRHGKIVRGMGYQLDIDGYSSNELSILSAHFFERATVGAWAYQQEPWSVVWIVLSSGDVLALTIQQEHQVTAWTRNVFRTPGRDICSIPGDGQDEVFLLCYTENQPATAKLTMLRRRADRAGEYNADTYRDESQYGYTSSFEGMELEQNVNGSLQGRHKHVPRVALRVFRAGGFHVGIMTENNQGLDQVTFPGDESPRYLDNPYTGDIYLNVPGGAGRAARIRIENRTPLPLTLLGVYQEVEIGGG